MKSRLGLLISILLCVVAIGYFVWPTPWINEPIERFQPSGFDLDTKSNQFQRVSAVRKNRFNGDIEEFIGGKWHHVICYFGCQMED